MPSSILSGITVQCHEERKQTNNTLAYSDRFLTCRKNTKKITPNNWEKKHCLGAARLHPSWCIQSTLSTLQAWEENPLAHCILYALTHFDSRHREQLCFSVPDFWVSCKQCPAAKWVQSLALQLSACTPGFFIAPRTQATGGRLKNPPSPTSTKTAVSRHTACSPPDLGSWPLPLSSQLRPAGSTYFTYIGDQTFQKCN